MEFNFIGYLLPVKYFIYEYLYELKIIQIHQVILNLITNYVQFIKLKLQKEQALYTTVFDM